VIYAVKVFKQGIQQGKVLMTEALNGKDACDITEEKLGLKAPRIVIDPRSGEMTVNGWHGFEFRARQLTTE
jgi:hypothetical protein